MARTIARCDSTATAVAPAGVGTVQRAHRLLALAGEHERPGQAEPGLGGQVGIAGSFGRLHRGPQVDERLGDPVAGTGGQAERPQCGGLRLRQTRLDGSVTSLDRQPLGLLRVLGGQPQRQR